jgi:hypothetical protein
MTSSLSLAKSIALIMCISACAVLQGEPKPVMDSDTEIKEITTAYYDGNIRKKYNDASNAQAKREWRNKVILGRMSAIDIRFNQFMKELFQGEVGKNLAADVATLGMGGAATLIGGGTGQALSAAITGITGAKSTFDKNVYFEKTMPVVIAAMIAERKTIELRIRRGLASNTDTYNLEAGLNDLIRYREAGKIDTAISVLREAAGEQARDASREIGALTASFVEDESGRKLRAFWKPDGKVNADNARSLREWMAANDVDELSIPFFINSDDYTDKRNEAVQHFGL